MQKSILVIGAGIAGLSCVEALCGDFNKANSLYNQVVLLSDSRLIKRISNYSVAGRQLESFDVIEATIDDLASLIPDGLDFKFILGSVKYLHAQDKKVYYTDGNENGDELSISYDRLCICTGAKPRLLQISSSNSNIQNKIIVIRDTDSVKRLQEKLKTCSKLVIVGNGGIGLELVTNIKNCDKTWIIRDDSIGLTYFDSGAAKFLLDSIVDKHDSCSKKDYVELKDSLVAKDNYGPSLGPNWSQDLEFKGNVYSSDKSLTIIYNDEAINVVENPEGSGHDLRVVTRNNNQFDCDLVAFAIGVEPNEIKVVDGHLKLDSSDGGILIDNEMRTSLEHVYAAGDIVSCANWNYSKLWFQKRLWTQARQMGYYAGKCIVCNLQSSDPALYFSFDCFTHCTSFFGHKVVLLGRYNGQNMDCDKKLRVRARVIPKKDYVKIILNDDGRIIGSVLVGDSGLEETIENLIYDKIDVSPFEDQLLDGTVDIEDYFD